MGPAPSPQEIIVEKAYWLSRQLASVKSAQNAATSKARLVHYDLAGRYSLKAMAAETLSDILPPAIYSGRIKLRSRDIDGA
jgi:hypothetical protein